MDYRTLTPVWEITRKCNMGCKHCGSSCDDSLENELTNIEALEVCKDLDELGVERVILSGGEPTARNDWKEIAKNLIDREIIVGMITNGWSLDEELTNEIVDLGISSIGISVDGLKETHDFIRKEGSFDRIMKALDSLKEKDINVIIPTTITKKNIDELESLKTKLKSKAVDGWQLQLGMPMGNFKSWNELVIEPEKLSEIVEFAYEVNQEDEDFEVFLGDCFGYYDLKRMKVDKMNYELIYGESKTTEKFVWQGCQAGKETFGILPTGDVVGCVAIREKNENFIFGNVREKSLGEILENSNNLNWIREIGKTELNGFCQKCKYGGECAGGCPNPRLLVEDNIYAENKFCIYNVKFKKAKEKIKEMNDYKELVIKGKKLAEKEKFQLAELLIGKALGLTEDNCELLNLYGYINFELNNYYQAKDSFTRVLAIDSNNLYANKKLGLVFIELGKQKRGLELLRKAVRLTDKDDLSPYHDLAMTLIKNDKLDKARNVLEKAKEISKEFVEKNNQLYKKAFN